ncbi:MAG: hypothetical protein JWQ88_264, partial [Rhodoferax sp.]|nr:hypothetical protein [Rhodoferax sp.]
HPAFGKLRTGLQGATLVDLRSRIPGVLEGI